VALTQDFSTDSAWKADIVMANAAEIIAIATILGNRGVNLGDEKGGA
jgi:hypothetical protein